MTRLSRSKRLAAGGALVLAGLGVGAAIGTTGSATAAGSATGTTSTTSADATAAATVTPDPSKPQRSDESLLTGTNLAKVTAAAMAKYPGATIQRVETDSDGVYEAHVVTKAGTDVIVQVGKDFTVTGTQTGHGGGGGGDHDGDGPGAGNPPAASSTS